MKCDILHITSLITAVVEGLFFSGLIFGWSSISRVLEQEGYFSNYCPSANSTLSNSTTSDNISHTTVATPSTWVTCHLQKEYINLVFTIASVALSFSTLPNGWIFDRFGTWASRVFAILLFTCGCVLVSVSTIATSWLLYPAMCCLSVGGILMLVTNMQIGNLFGSARSSVITLLNGALDSSSFVFLLVKLAYDSGIPLSTIFQFIAICSIFQWFRTILVMPKMHIPFPLPYKRFRYGLHDCKTQISEEKDPSIIRLQETGDEKMETKVEIEKPKQETASFVSCVKCVKFWTNLFHLSILQLRNYFFLGTFGTWMAGLLPAGSSELNGYFNAFGIFQFFGVLTAPLNGFLIDGMKKWFSRTTSDPSLTSAKAVAVSAFTTTLLGVLFSLIVAIPMANIQYVSFFLQVVFRSFLYGGNASFIAFSFPGKHFGKLYGLTMTLSGVVALLQFPLFSLVIRVLDEDFSSINIAFIVVCALTGIHPALMFWRSVKQEKMLKNQPKSVEQQNLTT